MKVTHKDQDGVLCDARLYHEANHSKISIISIDTLYARQNYANNKLLMLLVWKVKVLLSSFFIILAAPINYIHPKLILTKDFSYNCIIVSHRSNFIILQMMANNHDINIFSFSHFWVQFCLKNSNFQQARLWTWITFYFFMTYYNLRHLLFWWLTFASAADPNSSAWIFNELSVCLCNTICIQIDFLSHRNPSSDLIIDGVLASNDLHRQTTPPYSYTAAEFQNSLERSRFPRAPAVCSFLLIGSHVSRPISQYRGMLYAELFWRWVCWFESIAYKLLMLSR